MTMSWFGLVERMQEAKFTRGENDSMIKRVGVRGRPLVKFGYKVEEYWRKRNG